MKKLLLACAALAAAAVILVPLGPRILAQMPSDQSVTRPDHLTYNDMGTCNEGETEYNLTVHAGKRCTAANVWSQVMQGSVSEPNLLSNISTGISALRVAHATYKYSVDGGAISAITPAANATIPINAVITGAIVNSTAAFTGASGTIAIGTTAGSSATSIVSVVNGAVANYSLNGEVQATPVPQTASTWVKMSAAGQILVSIATTPMTTGQAEIFIFYVTSSS